MKIEIKKPGILYLTPQQLKIRQAVRASTHHATDIAIHANVSYSTLQYSTRGVHNPSAEMTEAILDAVERLDKNPVTRIVKPAPKTRRNRIPKKKYKSAAGTPIYLTPRQHEIRTAVMNAPFSIDAIASRSGVQPMTIRCWIIGRNEPHKALMGFVLDAIEIMERSQVEVLN